MDTLEEAAVQMYGFERVQRGIYFKGKLIRRNEFEGRSDIREA